MCGNGKKCLTVRQVGAIREGPSYKQTLTAKFHIILYKSPLQ